MLGYVGSKTRCLQKRLTNLIGNKWLFFLDLLIVMGLFNSIFLILWVSMKQVPKLLKKGIYNVLTRHNLQVENMRGQGYDGASNMRGARNGL